MVCTKTHFIISAIIESFNASYFVLRVPGVPQLNSFIYGNKTRVAVAETDRSTWICSPFKSLIE